MFNTDFDYNPILFSSTHVNISLITEVNQYLLPKQIAKAVIFNLRGGEELSVIGIL